MSFAKAQPQHVERFERLLAGIEGIERRRMFGYPAAFVNGNMAFGLYADQVMLRLPPDIRTQLLSEGWVQFEVMPGRAMGEYLALPGGINAGEDVARLWLQRSADYTGTLPPKEAKAKGKRS